MKMTEINFPCEGEGKMMMLLTEPLQHGADASLTPAGKSLQVLSRTKNGAEGISSNQHTFSMLLEHNSHSITLDNFAFDFPPERSPALELSTST